MGFMFAIFACLFIITYVIFNHYINIDQIKLPTLDTLSDLGLASKDETNTVDSTSKGHVKPSFFSFISSSSTQLEFFTLIGIIFNALMQGYVCVNSIYVYLLQDLEQDPSGFYQRGNAVEDDFEIN